MKWVKVGTLSSIGYQLNNKNLHLNFNPEYYSSRRSPSLNKTTKQIFTKSPFIKRTFGEWYTVMSISDEPNKT